MQKLHEDKILNKLYNKVARLYKQDKYEEIVILLDEIVDRRIQLGELDENEI